MKLTGRPDLLDRLAAHYALGVLRGGARRRLERLAHEEPSVRAAITHWQGRLAGMAELQPAAEPVDKVWCGIEERLGWKPRAGPGAPLAVSLWRRLWGSPSLWRGASAALAVVTVMAIGLSRIAVGPTGDAPTPNAVAILNDAQARPALLVTWDSRARAVTVRRLDHLDLTDQQVLQLWALPPGGKPRSLGVIGRQREARLAVAGGPDSVPALAVSIEPPGGSPNPDGPSGPVVFQGPLVSPPA